MNTYAVFGMQWGDEGKGKVVDVLAQDTDFVVRYQGGNNAGHTIIVNNKKIVLKLLPSGVFNFHSKCLLSHGMVIDPYVFLDEVSRLESIHIPTSHILISQRAHVIMPYHILMDEIQEKSKNRIGTTKKGIGPCYENKFRRTGIRMMDLLDINVLKEKIHFNLSYYNVLLQHFDMPALDENKMTEEYFQLGEELKPRIQEVQPMLLEAVKGDKKVIFEGAQATLLDIDDGFYPFVTSSHPSLGGIGSGSGIPSHYIKYRIGILKSYTSKVGEGPFPTEQNNQIGELIRETGGEYGSVTKRPRRCGWLDLFLSKYSQQINDLNHFVVTKLDILSGISKIYLAKGYKYKGSALTEIPYDINVLQNITVDYQEFEGFQLDLKKGYEHFSDLPVEAKRYLNYIEEYLGISLLFVSVGPEREANIWKNSL